MALKLDLNVVETHQLSSIAIADTSFYDNYNISNPSFEVTPPGFGKINVPFNPKSINVYRANDLGIGCDDDSVLPDGIYVFKYSIRPNASNFVEKSFLLTRNVTAKLHKKILETTTSCPCDNNYSSKLDRRLSEIKALIEGAHSAHNLCKDREVYELLKRANKLLKSKDLDCECR